MSGGLGRQDSISETETLPACPTACVWPPLRGGRTYQRAKKAYEALAKKADKDAVARGTDMLKRLNRSDARRAATAKSKAQEANAT
jgi:hypothetical protein